MTKICLLNLIIAQRVLGTSSAEGNCEEAEELTLLQGMQQSAISSDGEEAFEGATQPFTLPPGVEPPVSHACCSDQQQSFYMTCRCEGIHWQYNVACRITVGSNPNPTPVVPGSCDECQNSDTQFTPCQSEWDLFYEFPAAVSSVTGHDPDAVKWISNWPTWDGVTINPITEGSNFGQKICPSGDTIVGIREVFYQHNPFADNQHPTKAEVDEWHRIAINHVRALVGYTEPERQVEKDHCMSARALWGNQRRHDQTMWAAYGASYTGNNCPATGPCFDGNGDQCGNSHCGASFIPSAEDQIPFLPPGHPPCTAAGGSEGIFSGPKMDIPWSIKWSRAFCSTIHSEGFWGGHTGPFFHRQKFGFDFWPVNNANGNAELRAKWTGQLMPSKYAQPR